MYIYINICSRTWGVHENPATHILHPNRRQYIAAKGDPNATSGTGASELPGDAGGVELWSFPLMQLRDLTALQPLKIHILKPEKFSKI